MMTTWWNPHAIERAPLFLSFLGWAVDRSNGRLGEAGSSFPSGAELHRKFGVRDRCRQFEYETT
jgi:hypothetical protein